ncbi:hypothetical protein LUD75_09275 [Epilithonimonas sp. JDS]|uniref:hypothetical protein n=1 Tax=Epilithonimonas sp. JDS TaxID=2902797 RepID=UPI001E55F1F5|nr:hypothetical protein [Epilithonimonas sp. JDS]MCD9854895.1 hypothetical protein [Epilithonimonas sp. JDS]
MKTITILIFSITIIACEKSEKTKISDNEKPRTDAAVFDKNSDSVALLQLTKNLYDWEENKSKTEDFPTIQKDKKDTVYSEIDFKKHQSRLQDLRNSNLFSEKFISNYNRIASSIDKELQKGTMVYNIGELPPYGNGSNPWCNCQDVPDGFLDKIWIMNLAIKENIASYNWSWGDGLVYHIEAIRENKSWKILNMDGFDYDSFIRTFQKNNDFTGYWENGMVTISVSKTSLNFEYHGQCMYTYPIKQLSDTDFEMIWAREMDCKFDNGTDRKFGLKNVPEIGKAFARFSLKNKVLNVDYYYKDWVDKYSKEVHEGVFTSDFYKKNY